MTFTVTRLAGNRAVVSGTDAAKNKGSVILDTTQYDHIAHSTAVAEATAEFDATVHAFYAEIEAATDKLTEAQNAPVNSDDRFKLVVSEAVEGACAHPEISITLSKDTVILRLIDAGESDQLVWVGDALEILAV